MSFSTNRIALFTLSLLVVAACTFVPPKKVTPTKEAIDFLAQIPMIYPQNTRLETIQREWATNFGEKNSRIRAPNSEREHLELLAGNPTTIKIDYFRKALPDGTITNVALVSANACDLSGSVLKASVVSFYVLNLEQAKALVKKLQSLGIIDEGRSRPLNKTTTYMKHTKDFGAWVQIVEPDHRPKPYTQTHEGAGYGYFYLGLKYECP